MGLGGGVTFAVQDFFEAGNPGGPAQAPGEQGGLVEFAFPFLEGMQGHGQEAVPRLLA